MLNSGLSDFGFHVDSFFQLKPNPRIKFNALSALSAAFIAQLPRSAHDLNVRFTKTKIPLLNQSITKSTQIPNGRPRAQSTGSVGLFNKSRRKSGEINTTVSSVRSIINPGMTGFSLFNIN